MRFMVIVKASQDSEAGKLPSQELLTEMGKFNEELVKAGIMLAGEGLQASSKGARVKFSGGKRTVIDGPFAETKELIAGFWIWRCKSLQEAIDWVKRCPAPMGPNEESEIEIRPVFEAEDFGAEFTPEFANKRSDCGKQLPRKSSRRLSPPRKQGTSSTQIVGHLQSRLQTRSKFMKYMLLIYTNERSWTDSERQHCYAESTQLTHELNSRGQYLAAAPLEPVATATSVRVREGKRLVTDGPFAETANNLAGTFSSRPRI